MTVDVDTGWTALLGAVLDTPVTVHEAGPVGERRCLFDNRRDGVELSEREVTVGRRRLCVGSRIGDRDSEAAAALVESLLRLQAERDDLAADLEAMYPSSLALLEEASMWGDVLPTLSTGSSDVEIAERGLAALVVAAGVERAVYVRYRSELDQCEVAVQVAMEAGRPRVWGDADGPLVLSRDDEVVWHAIVGDGSARLLTVPDGGGLGEPGSVASLARRQLIAVPVRYGGDGHGVTLGVLLVMDRREHLLASHGDDLSSHETKLAHAVAAMLGSVLGTRRVAEMGKELEAAQTIHRQIQASDSVHIDGFEVVGNNRACGTVGGDYFDFLPMADGRTFGVVVDVSGHDLASGMLMVSARIALRVLAARQRWVGALFDELAEFLSGDLRHTERFLTAAGVALTPGSRTVEVVSAGHPDVMVLRAADGVVERIGGDAPVLGFVDGIRHHEREATLAAGDVLLLYTDGLVEAENAAEEMLGDDRVEQTLRTCVGMSARQVMDTLIQAVEQHRGRRVPHDDVTLLVVKAVAQAEERR